MRLIGLRGTGPTDESSPVNGQLRGPTDESSPVNGQLRGPTDESSPVNGQLRGLPDQQSVHVMQHDLTLLKTTILARQKLQRRLMDQGGVVLRQLRSGSVLLTSTPN